MSLPASAADPRSDPVFAGARISEHRETGRVRFVGMNPGRGVGLGYRPGQGRPEDYGLAFAAEHGAAFGVMNAAQQLRLSKSRARPQGGQMLRYQQLHQGVPVFAGELIINLDHGKALLSMNGELSPDLEVSVTPTLEPDEAVEIALRAVAKWYDLDGADLQSTEAELTVYDARLLKHSILKPSLTWRIEVTAEDIQPVNELLLIDAHSGAISLHFNQIHAAKSRLTYDMGGTTAPLPGTLICQEGDAFPDCAGGDQDVINAHAFAGDTYDFYESRHGRDGIDGAGSAMISSVHFDVGYRNAFWDGVQMVYGDGFADADDVVGHELTHGVTQYESNLLYYYQSGAINESLSDVWGEFVDLANDSGDDSPEVRWLLGEDLTIIGGAIRDMKNPPAFGDPDRMTSEDYWTSSGDSGGVHINSGINNKAAYLLTDGDTFNGVAVAGLGFDKTARIYYEAQSNLLTSGSDYADLYDYLHQACLNLAGTSGIAEDDCNEVRAATDAVEMNLEPAGDAGFSPDAALCPDGEAPGSALFAEDFETSLPWQTVTLAGTENPWYLSDWYATSGQHALVNFDVETMADAVVWNTVPVALSGAVYLHFRHAYAFEAGLRNYDGGVIEYSTNGTDWLDLGSMFVDGQPYAGTIYAGTPGKPSTNPLGGREGFVGDSHGYVSSRYYLGALAGQSFQLRFRAASDSFVGGPLGWVVDDVMIYPCEPEGNAPPNTPSAPAPEDTADTVAVAMTLSWSGGDPDGDPVTYDVWLESGDATPDVLVCDDVATSSCNPVGDFAYDTTYHWQVEARDSHGAAALGPVWTFTTGSGPDVTCSGVDVLIQNRTFGTDTTCVATSSLTANSTVLVQAGATVTFVSPSTTLGPDFIVEKGAGFTVHPGDQN